jgi:hypothetical protein
MFSLRLSGNEGARAGLPLLLFGADLGEDVSLGLHVVVVKAVEQFEGFDVSRKTFVELFRGGIVKKR